MVNADQKGMTWCKNCNVLIAILSRKMQKKREIFSKIFFLSLHQNAWRSFYTQIGLTPLAGSPEVDPLAVKLLDNQPYMLNTC